MDTIAKALAANASEQSTGQEIPHAKSSGPKMLPDAVKRLFPTRLDVVLWSVGVGKGGGADDGGRGSVGPSGGGRGT